MQFPWLEKLANEGQISKEARDEIYRDCSALLKVADQKAIPWDEFQRIEANAHAVATKVTGAIRGLGQKAQAFAMNPYGAAALTGIFSAGMGRFAQGREQSQTVKQIVANRNRLATEFPSDHEKAQARFDEVAKLAPHAAANWPLVSKLVHDRLQSGFTAGDVSNLALLQASATPTTRALTAMQKRASAERLGAMYADVFLLAHEKTAAAGMPQVKSDTLKRVLTHTLAMASVPILTGVGVGAVNQMKAWRDSVNQKRKLEAAYHAALNASDSELLTQNPEKARQAFTTLAHFAPHVAMEPNAARSFMKKLVAYDVGVQVGDIKDLSDIQKNMAGRGGPSPFFRGLAAGAEATGLRDVVRSGVDTVGKPMGGALSNQVLDDLVDSGADPYPRKGSRFAGLRDGEGA